MSLDLTGINNEYYSHQSAIKDRWLDWCAEEVSPKNGPVERVIQYVEPFDCCSREQDYQTVWQHIDQRFNH